MKTKNQIAGILFVIFSSLLATTSLFAQQGPSFSAAKAQEVKMPEFNGDLISFLSENLRYPEQALKDSLAGRVVIQFTITEEGKVKDCKVVKSVADLLDQEALRVAKMTSGKWIPGEIDGNNRDSEYFLPVVFALGQNHEDE